MTDMDIPATARALGVSERTVRRWIASGRLPAFRLGGRIRVPERAVREAAVPYGAAQPAADTGAEGPEPAESPVDPLVAWLTRPERKAANRATRRRRAIETIDRIRSSTLPPQDENDTVEAYIREMRDEQDMKADRILGIDRP